jgi:SAM-dependent methyltransferase
MWVVSQRRGETTVTSTHDDREALDVLIRGYQVSRMLGLAADLNLADRIPERGTVAVGALAGACGVEPVPLLRILRALAAFQVFAVTAEGEVSHSARSLLLRTDAPGSLALAARFWTDPGCWKAWGALGAALTGGIPHEVAWGMGRFDYLRRHPESARLFDAFMASFPDRRHEAIASSYDFAQAQHIVDVGGGNGETLRHVLRRHPEARGLVLDRPDVVEAIPADARLAGRIEVEGGSFLEHVPGGADLYLLVRVLHDWPDDDCVRILKNCRRAAPAHARLLIVEQLLEPDPARGRPTTYLLDVQMLTMFGGGRERSVAEFEQLLGAAGFRLLRVIPTASAICIVEAAPVAESASV